MKLCVKITTVKLFLKINGKPTVLAIIPLKSLAKIFLNDAFSAELGARSPQNFALNPRSDWNKITISRQSALEEGGSYIQIFSEGVGWGGEV